MPLFTDMPKFAAPARQPRLRGAALALCIALGVSVLVLYLPVRHFGFLTGWDDNFYVTANSHISSGLSRTNAVWALTARSPYYWQPLSFLSHMLDCQLFGLNAGPHHLVNVVLHALNAMLLFLLLYHATAALWRSFLVSALFAWHPSNVATVAWLAERHTLLCSFFTLVTIAAYGWYAQRPGWRRYLAVACAFMLALMSKPIAVSLPLLLLLLDYWPLQRGEGRLWGRGWGALILEKIPLVAISALVSVATVTSETASETIIPFSRIPLATRLEYAPIAYAGYLGKFLLPVKLSPFYLHPVFRTGPVLPRGEVALSLLLLACVTAAVLFATRSRAVRMGWAFFLLLMIPMIGLIQTGMQGRRDHFTYIPAIGVFLALVWLLTEAVEKIPIHRLTVVVATVGILGGYAYTTTRYELCWRNNVTLFQRAREVDDRPNSILDQFYADALLDAGRPEEAMPYYQRSCRVDPYNEYCHFGMAEILFGRQQYRSALEEYQATLSLTRHKHLIVAALTHAAEAMLNLKDYDGANRAVAQALQLDPGDSTAQYLQWQLQSMPQGAGR